MDLPHPDQRGGDIDPAIAGKAAPRLIGGALRQHPGETDQQPHPRQQPQGAVSQPHPGPEGEAAGDLAQGGKGEKGECGHLRGSRPGSVPA